MPFLAFFGPVTYTYSLTNDFSIFDLKKFVFQGLLFLFNAFLIPLPTCTGGRWNTKDPAATLARGVANLARRATTAHGGALPPRERFFAPSLQ